MNNNIYLDYAATTPTDEVAFEAALPYYRNIFFNPSSTHALGQKAAGAVERSREKCAAAINADPREIYFTSGGTEAINWAMRNMPEGKRHAVVSSIEHDSVIECAAMLAERGIEVDFVKPDKRGTVTPDALKKSMRNDTGLVCVMLVNNIVGSIQPVKALASVAHESGALFFTDAVQAINAVDVDVKDYGADMLAVAGHKFYAPKGVGFLYVDKRIEISPLFYGGEQERGRRAGTVDVPATVAMGAAIELACKTRSENNAHAAEIRSEFLKNLECGKPVACDRAIDDIVSVVFDGINGGRLAVALSCAGVCCSVGSACSAGSATPPRTLTEMGVANADCSVRFSFGKTTSVDEVKAAAHIINDTVKRLYSVNR